MQPLLAEIPLAAQNMINAPPMTLTAPGVRQRGDGQLRPQGDHLQVLPCPISLV
jgi:hypothetical protein